MPIHESTPQPSTTLFAKQVWALSKKSLITYWRGANGLFMLIRIALLTLIINGTKEGFFERLLVVLTIIYAITVLEDAIQDKTEKYKEFLMIGGVSNLSYLSSMVLLAYFKCILFTVLMCSGYLFLQDSDIYPLRPGQVILLYLIAMITMTNYLLLLSVFFSSKRTGFLLFGFTEFITIFLPNQTKISLYAYIIFPQKLIFFPKTGYNFLIPTYFNFYGYISLTFLIGLVYLLVFCLYHVWTIKNGSAKIRKMHPKDTPISNENQSLMEDFRSSTVDSIPTQPTSFSVEIRPKDTDTSSALYHEKIEDSETLHQSIYFKSVSKSFGSEKVIDNLSFMAYESQIFCLLGHNGAGKTTTINLMTGTLNPDSGEIYYEAQSLHNNLESLRKTIGLCDQQGILYPDLTVEEHLQLISQVRGRSGEELHNEVENIIRKVELDSERTKIVNTLSEGSKRKLSLGLAILCGTRLLFLDEPTIGMDPNTRRRVWDIIKQLRDEGRCIILTTHLLDEAEELADRVGILSKGKLFALGSPEFIKKKFGVGYHLEITPNCDVNCTKEQFEHAALKIQKIIKEHILSAQQEDNQGGDSVKFLLPVSQQHAFPQVFEQLEAFQEIKLNLKMNNLEDAFINIGMTDLFQNELTSGLLTNERNDQDFNINPPEALKNLIPKYSFLSQIKAIWKYNHLLVKRKANNTFLITKNMKILMLLTVFALLDINREGKRSFYGIYDFFQSHPRLYFIPVILLNYSLMAPDFSILSSNRREEGINHLLRSMGCRSLPCWLGTLTFDMLAIQPFNFGIILIFYIFFTPYITNMLATFILASTLFGINLITLVYFGSFILKTSQITTKLSNFMCQITLIGVPLFVYSLFVNGKMAYIPQSLKYPVLLIVLHSGPYLAFNDIFLLSIKAKPVFFETQTQCMLWLVWLGFVYMMGTIFLHKYKFKVSLGAKKTIQDRNIDISLGVDASEIISEATRIESESAEDPIKVLNLSKVYPNGFKAIKDLSFGVQKGELFGLLGPNGAGKSTTLGILTSMLPRTGGRIEFGKQSIDKNIDEVYQCMGVCPQLDAVWKDLTVDEHLLIYARIKGIASSDRSEIIEYILDVLILKAYRSKKADELSGGNRRKLSIAIAMIANPSLLFLDEPTTGVDPISRKRIWSCLKKLSIATNSATVLATHSMEEAEALCDRIGIIVNGEFVCIGSLRSLKDKYGSGYRVTIVKNENSGSINERVLKIFPDAKKIQDSKNNHETYQVRDGSFKFSRVLRELQYMKTGGIISDFSIYRTTLEQVFIHFSQLQEHSQQSFSQAHNILV